MGRKIFDYPNTIQLNTTSGGIVNRKIMITAVHEQLDVEYEDIACFGPQHDTKQWLFSLRKDIVAEDLVGRKVILKLKKKNIVNGKQIEEQIEEEIIVENYIKIKKKRYIYESYKLMWLPFFQNECDIKEFISDALGTKEIRIKKCFEEEYIDRDDENHAVNNLGKKIETGIWRVYLSYEENVRVNEIKGTKLKYYGNRILIVKLGDKVKCFGCREYGHLRMECPNVNEICANCKKTGHKSCSYADQVELNDMEGGGQLPEDMQFGGGELDNDLGGDLGGESGADDESLTIDKLAGAAKKIDKIKKVNGKNSLLSPKISEQNFENLGRTSKFNEKRTRDELDSSVSTTISSDSPLNKDKKTNKKKKDNGQNETEDEITDKETSEDENGQKDGNAEKMDHNEDSNKQGVTT